MSITAPYARPTVAVVGAGIAGCACAAVLIGAGVDVTVLDRGRAAGGRMSSRTLHGRPVDLGASYLTARDPRFQAVLDAWVDRGVARPWTDRFPVLSPAGLGAPKPGPMRYGAPAGLRSLVEDLAGPLQVRQQAQVTAVGPGPVVHVDGEPPRPYDAVVLAMPDPQALAVLDIGHTEARAAVAAREWLPVLALAAGFDARGWDLDGAFVHDDPVLEWVADDGTRRGDGAPVLVAHSTSAFAAAHLQDPAAAETAMVAALTGLLALPAPTWAQVQRWTYAKPAGPRDEPFHLGPEVGLCGDGWGASKVEAAWLSGTALGEALSARLQNP